MTALPEAIGVVATAVALAGVVCNNKRWRSCFVLWLFSNSLTLALHVNAGMWSLAARDAAFLVLAVHGRFAWARKSE